MPRAGGVHRMAQAIRRNLKLVLSDEFRQPRQNTLGIRPRAPKLRALNNLIPRDLETICLKCLCKDPDGRYSTANECAADFRRWLDGAPILARPVSRWEKLRLWRRRNPVTAVLMALISLLVTFSLISGTSCVFFKFRAFERIGRQGTSCSKQGRGAGRERR